MFSQVILIGLFFFSIPLHLPLATKAASVGTDTERGFDVGVISIESPDTVVGAGHPISPVATVKNFSSSSVDFPCICLIESLGVEVYADTQQVIGLLPDSTTSVVFSSWTPHGAGNIYLIHVRTALLSDTNAVNDTLSKETTAIIAYQSGWPINTGGSTSESSPQVVDIDNDGNMEILIGSGWGLSAYHYDGTIVNGFPVSVGGYADYTPAIADIDKDGEMEIAIAGQRSELYIYKSDGTLESGWPQYLGDDDGASSSPALFDLDGDDTLEIIIGTYCDLNGNAGGIPARMYVFRYDGTIYPGWPVDSVDSYGIISSPALGDIDNDGDFEIIVGAREDQKLWAWHSNGTVVSGFPVSVSGYIESSPTLADVDNDGDLEIFIATSAEYVYGFHHDGTLVSGWPMSMGGGSLERSSPSIGDIDGDGDLAIVCGSWHGYVYAWHHDGTLVSGWPQQTGTAAQNFAQGTPALADIEGNGDIEVVSGAYTGVWAWHYNGVLLPGFPLETGWSRSSPTISDIDQDGDVEILIGALNNYLYIWDLEGTYTPSKIEWTSFRHDLWNTGLYRFNYVGVEENRNVVGIYQSHLLQNIPNPFYEKTTIYYQISKPSFVSLIIYDITGRVVRNLICKKQQPGNYQIFWDGRDNLRRKVKNGIYFCELKSKGGSTLIKKMVLIH